MKLQVLLILFQVAQVKSLREVSGYLGDNVTLPSGAIPSWTLSTIEWSIFSNNTWIATYRDKKTVIERVDRYKGRLSLNTSTGDLTIHHLTPEDEMEYTVELINTEAEHRANKIKVIVRKRLQRPTIEAFESKARRCSWFLLCSSTDTDVHLSWQGVPPSGTVQNLTNPVLPVRLNATENQVEITCTSSRNTDEASSVSALKCDGEPEPETQPTAAPQPQISERTRYTTLFLVGFILGCLLIVIMVCLV